MRHWRRLRWALLLLLEHRWGGEGVRGLGLRDGWAWSAEVGLLLVLLGLGWEVVEGAGDLGFAEEADLGVLAG